MTQAVETKFTFKSRTLKDENDKEIGKSRKQPEVKAELPFPTIDEIVAYMQSTDEAHTKVKALILESVWSIVRDQAKSQLDDRIDQIIQSGDEEKTVSVADIDFDALSLEYIANLPPAQRGARAIPEEDWKVFYEDYANVMVAATGKPIAKIKNHLEHFQKPTRIKTAKDILAALIQQIDVYVAATGMIEDTGECAQRVRGKFDKWLKEDQKFDVDAL